VSHVKVVRKTKLVEQRCAFLIIAGAFHEEPYYLMIGIDIFKLFKCGE